MAVPVQLAPEASGPNPVATICTYHWPHRTLILRTLKGLEQIISVSVVNPYMGEQGWTFEPGPGVVPDPVGQAEYLYSIYQRAQPGYSGRVTVTVLWEPASEHHREQRVVGHYPHA